MRIYYAHSIGLYESSQEHRDAILLARLGLEVVNPNAPEHQVAYSERGMDYFRDLAAECDALAFRAHPDGMIPAGIAKEVAVARDAGKPVIELPHHWSLARRTLSVDETRTYLSETGAR